MTIDWSDPAARDRLIECVGPDEYNRLHAEQMARSTVATPSTAPCDHTRCMSRFGNAVSGRQDRHRHSSLHSEAAEEFLIEEESKQLNRSTPTTMPSGRTEAVHLHTTRQTGSTCGSRKRISADRVKRSRSSPDPPHILLLPPYLSKVQSVDRRMRLGMRCRLSPTADVPSHTSGPLTKAGGFPPSERAGFGALDQGSKGRQQAR